MAPNRSVTGFHRSSTKKPNPKVRNAGSDPAMSATMMPPRMTSTAIAAARVAIRNKASPSRRRSSALDREKSGDPATAPPGNAISVTDRLPTGVMRLPLASSSGSGEPT